MGAIKHFLQAERLKPDGWKENRLFLAKCHIGLGDYNQAVIWLDKADSIPLASQDVREGIKIYNERFEEEKAGYTIKMEVYRKLKDESEHSLNNSQHGLITHLHNLN